jgi:rhodanese-related sulfurtransferase
VTPGAMKVVEPMQLKALLDGGEKLTLLDVREPEEVALAAIPGAIHIPMREIQQRTGELDAKTPIVVLCHHGVRSQMVAGYLLQQGFIDVANLRGGIDRYAAAVDPSIARY